jgi:ATP-dependent Zn protease
MRVRSIEQLTSNYMIENTNKRISSLNKYLQKDSEHKNIIEEKVKQEKANRRNSGPSSGFIFIFISFRISGIIFSLSNYFYLHWKLSRHNSGSNIAICNIIKSSPTEYTMAFTDTEQDTQ